MRSVGIIGGLGPESTIDYYRSIIQRVRARKPGAGYPHIIINSLDIDQGIAMLDAGRLDDLADYLSSGIESLERAGAEFAAIAANTPHLVFPDLERRSRIPLVSIVRATCDHVKARGFKKVGLLGTGFTMRANFYREEFEREGIDMLRPTEPEQVLSARLLGREQFVKLPQAAGKFLHQRKYYMPESSNYSLR